MWISIFVKSFLKQNSPIASSVSCIPPLEYAVACLSASGDAVPCVYTPSEYLKCQNGARAAFTTTLSQNTAIRRWSYVCKKDIRADPLAYTFDRVPLSVEYIKGREEWGKMNARSLPQHPGLVAAGMENKDLSPLHFSSYLREQSSTSTPTMRQC